MQYRGTVRGGVVVLDQGSALEEGAEVWVELRPAPGENGKPTLWQKYAGIIDDLPPDMAANHDHYIHGGPKK